ncbi:hypothetical protein Sulac_1140 [Sulfobacillus acidophilus DSM 10332]|uniref:Uncharacterized protein n=1 Tax=Sulfobacillus acidophilus (strain ATCC 700253 / DSM 10332 / NAL) TaxID=679936 RepID=G8TUJ3_SULAD|nr:hypothetical protein Sulac_1140 [Sulfobacillus acidophilus DSM 10332]
MMLIVWIVLAILLLPVLLFVGILAVDGMALGTAERGSECLYGEFSERLR